MEVPEDKGLPVPDWIVTFTDLMSLLLTFFILLLTFSTPRVERLFELRGSIDGSFGIISGAQNDNESIVDSSLMLIGRDQRNPFAPSTPPRYLPLEEREPNIDLMRLKNQEGEAIDYQKIEDGFLVRISDSVQFTPGSMVMTAESFRRIAKLAKELQHYPHHVVITGYVGVDEIGIFQQQNKDIMDVAIRRAVHVAQRLVEYHQINPDILAVAGYGPQPGDLQPGRIEFVLADRRRFAGRR